MSATLPALATYEGAVAALGKAKTALIAATSVDQVLDVRAQADALRAFAKIAGDRSLECDGAELRFQAERQIGVMIALQRDGVGLARNGASAARLPTLEDAGIDKDLAKRARAYAALDADAFAAHMARRRADIEAGRKRVTVDLFDGTDKAARRAEREAALAQKHCGVPGRVYNVIYDDPAWRHEVRSRETGLDRGAENHYPTMPAANILALDAELIVAIAAPDCAWFRWTTNQHLAIALRSGERFGFTYRSSWIWDKGQIGKGYWNRNRHEQLLLFVRGDVPCPSEGMQWPSLMGEKPTRHSAKPAVFAAMIEAYFPTLPKIEMNCRGLPRNGWDGWGNECEARPAMLQAAE